MSIDLSLDSPYCLVMIANHSRRIQVYSDAFRSGNRLWDRNPVGFWVDATLDDGDQVTQSQKSSPNGWWSSEILRSEVEEGGRPMSVIEPRGMVEEKVDLRPLLRSPYINKYGKEPPHELVDRLASVRVKCRVSFSPDRLDWTEVVRGWAGLKSDAGRTAR